MLCQLDARRFIIDRDSQTPHPLAIQLPNPCIPSEDEELTVSETTTVRPNENDSTTARNSMTRHPTLTHFRHPPSRLRNDVDATRAKPMQRRKRKSCAVVHMMREKTGETISSGRERISRNCTDQSRACRGGDTTPVMHLRLPKHHFGVPHV